MARTTYVEDGALVADLRRGEPRAMEVLYDRLGRQAFGLAYRILGDGPAAEDVVQEAFLTIWRQVEKINPARGKLNSLLMTIVHNKAIDVVRSKRGSAARQELIDFDTFPKEGSDVAERILESLDREAVRDVLARLPADQRKAIEMAFFEGFTHVEIAEALALPLGTVKSRLRLGLEKMRLALNG